MNLRAYFIMLILLVSNFALADRPFHSRADLEKWGFQKALAAPSFSASALSVPAVYNNTLPFPLTLEQPSEQFGAVMHQLQDYSSPAYFHGGLDIHGQKHQEVRSPVFGKVEAGYYSYTDEFDGRSTKYYLPYREALVPKDNPPWSIYYFEVSVTDKNGYRFEFHHVDPEKLPDTLREKILRGGAVAPGELLGHLIDWPSTLFGRRYHHLHYNVIHPNGMFINPFSVSEPVMDTLPPTIVGIYATAPSRCGSTFPSLVTFTDAPVAAQNEIVIEAYDKITEGQAKHAPAVIAASFEGHKNFSWDFSKALALPSGALPNITQMYLYYLCDEKKFLQVASKSFRLYFRVPLPENYSGPSNITISDFAGNSTQQTIYIQ